MCRRPLFPFCVGKETFARSTLFIKPGPNEDESQLKLSLSFDLELHALSSTLVRSHRIQLNLVKFFMRVVERELSLVWPTLHEVDESLRDSHES